MRHACKKQAVGVCMKFRVDNFTEDATLGNGHNGNFLLKYI